MKPETIFKMYIFNLQKRLYVLDILIDVCDDLNNSTIVLIRIKVAVLSFISTEIQDFRCTKVVNIESQP